MIFSTNKSHDLNHKDLPCGDYCMQEINQKHMHSFKIFNTF